MYKQIIVFLFTVIFCSGCDFARSVFSYKDTTQGFVEAIINEEFDKSLMFMSTESELFENTNLDTLKLSFANFRTVVVDNFGEELVFKLMTATKRFSTEEAQSTAPKTTVAQIQFSNEEEFGVFEVVFDDNSNKILNIKTLDVKEKVPDMLLFWCFGILALLVPIFNIWIIRKISASRLRKKWLKYLAVVVFNFPALTYAAVKGFSIAFLSFQIMLGISFSYMGYLGSFWTFGLPLGGLYWLWKLNNLKEDESSLKIEIVKE